MYNLNYSSDLISEPILCVLQINHNNNIRVSRTQGRGNEGL